MYRILIPILFSPFLFSQSLSWYGDYDKAHQEALRTHKPLLVLIVKRDDVKTNYILQHVFANQPYIETLNRYIISAMVMYEGKASYPIEMYYTTEFPTLFLVNEEELFLCKPIYGSAITKEKIIQILKSLQ